MREGFAVIIAELSFVEVVLSFVWQCLLNICSALTALF